MDRPRLSIAWDASDWLLEVISGVTLGFLIYNHLSQYGTLPEIIPRHYNFAGEADGYGSKELLWLTPIFALVLYIGLTAINRIPHLFNYLTEITEENAYRQYRAATKLIRALKLVVIAGFTFMHWRTVQIATDKNSDFGQWFSPVFMGSMFFLLIFYIAYSRRKK
jgi:uncharacterized membrane protein